MNKTKNIVLSSLFLALAMILPFLTGQIPEIGSMLCPLHIPALLAGYFCGWQYGLIVGAMSPLLRSILFSMPPMISGLLYNILPKKKINIYVSLIIAMIIGRGVWGIVKLAMVGFNISQFGWPMFISGAFISAIPGIILQLVLIPVLVLTIKKN